MDSRRKDCWHEVWGFGWGLGVWVVWDSRLAAESFEGAGDLGGGGGGGAGGSEAGVWESGCSTICF